VQGARAGQELSERLSLMRFLAPARAGLDPARFAHPVFEGLAPFKDLLLAEHWPALADLDARLQPLRHGVSGLPLALVGQAVLDDAENYERRIFQRGLIATRDGNWHDLFNALVWRCFPAIKSALNAAQVEDMARMGLAERTRRQCALTQFDEAGAIVLLRDPELLPAWDRHDWPGLFLDRQAAWRDGGIRLWVFGHALYEHALNPDMLLVSKTLVLVDDGQGDGQADMDRRVAAAIAARHCLADPQQLRPLPMPGIPAWHPRRQDAAFYRELPCFRPLRPGRIYPPPLGGAISKG
jgi:hypothetical protein